MKKLIEWLKTVEFLAESFYRQAAERFPGDPDLTSLLLTLAEDERDHIQILDHALELLRKKPQIESPIRFDADNRTRLEGPLLRADHSLDRNTLTRSDVIRCIADIEFSEWNDLFLYAIRSLESLSPGYKSTLPAIQRHLRQIERFLEEDPEGRSALKTIRGLPPVWEEHFLVVDDFKPITDLLATLLEPYGRVETASNGKNALEKLKSRYFAVVISDLEMPVMDGWELLKRSREVHPDLVDRFIFMTGDAQMQQDTFFNRRKVRLISKPFVFNDMLNAVMNVLETDTPPGTRPHPSA